MSCITWRHRLIDLNPITKTHLTELKWQKKVCLIAQTAREIFLTPVSKHSRAARRGELSHETEDRSLEKVPRAENDDVKKSIIRTTIKNENLLVKKMEKDKIRKKSNKKLNNSLRNKADRSTKVEGVLATKIQQSIDRAKFIQTTRKAGWDQINRTLNIKPVSESTETKAVEKTEEEMEQDAEDAYVKDFYADLKNDGNEGNGDENGDDIDIIDVDGAQYKAKQLGSTNLSKTSNMFSLLQEESE